MLITPGCIGGWMFVVLIDVIVVKKELRVPFSSSSHGGSQDGFLSHAAFLNQNPLLPHSFSMCCFVFFPSVSLCKSLGWKIDVAGDFCNYYYYWAWSITVELRGGGGVCHHKGKDITLTVKGGNIWCLFPSPSLAESSRTRRGWSGEGARQELQCCTVLLGLQEPCPSISLLVLCSVELPLILIIFLPLGTLGGWEGRSGENNLKRCYPKKLQTPAAKQWKWGYGWSGAEFSSCSPRHEPWLGAVGRSKRLHVPVCNR